VMSSNKAIELTALRSAAHSQRTAYRVDSERPYG
jgi:hypothetical protein